MKWGLKHAALGLFGHLPTRPALNPHFIHFASLHSDIMFACVRASTFRCLVATVLSLSNVVAAASWESDVPMSSLCDIAEKGCVGEREGTYPDVLLLQTHLGGEATDVISANEKVPERDANVMPVVAAAPVFAAAPVVAEAPVVTAAPVVATALDAAAAPVVAAAPAVAAASGAPAAHLPAVAPASLAQAAPTPFASKDEIFIKANSSSGAVAISAVQEEQEGEASEYGPDHPKQSKEHHINLAYVILISVAIIFCGLFCLVCSGNNGTGGIMM
mmetsp:Transcript_135195/g.289098  ORF Transcript_135195/g.289098 Transcript_135195/m.289098 type:complete len:274 (-) Transcript_135195:107-928(-)